MSSVPRRHRQGESCLINVARRQLDEQPPDVSVFVLRAAVISAPLRHELISHVQDDARFTSFLKHKQQKNRKNNTKIKLDIIISTLSTKMTARRMFEALVVPNCCSESVCCVRQYIPRLRPWHLRRRGSLLSLLLSPSSFSSSSRVPGIVRGVLTPRERRNSTAEIVFGRTRKEERVGGCLRRASPML